MNTCTELYVNLLRRFSLYCLCFGSRSKHHNRCNIYLKSESITGQPASKLVVMRKLPGSSRTVVFVLRTKVFAKTILQHYSQTMLTKTVRISKTHTMEKKRQQKQRQLQRHHYDPKLPGSYGGMAALKRTTRQKKTQFQTRLRHQDFVRRCINVCGRHRSSVAS